MGRISDAWRALTGQRSEEVQRAHDILTRVLQGAQPPRKGSRELLLAYRHTPWLRAATSRIATATASASWHLYAAKRSGTARAIGRLPGAVLPGNARAHELGRLRAAGELKEIEVHPLLDLLARPNPAMSGFAARKLQQVWLDIKGEGFGILERNAAGMPVELWPVPPHWIADVATPDRPNYRASYLSWQREIPAADVLWLRDLDVENPYGRGSGIGEALADELSADEYAAKMVAAKLFNSGIPDLLIGIEGGKDDAREFKEKWREEQVGVSKRGGFHVFPKGKVSVEKLSPSFVDLALNDLRSWQRNVVIQVFGMPPEILGIIENSNRSTIDSAEYLFARGVVVPRLELLRSEYQERLVPEFDDKLILEYENPVPEDREFKLKAMQAAPFAHLVDEWRAVAGAEPLDGKKGQVFQVPAGVGFVPDPSKVKPAAPAAVPFGGRGASADPAWARATRKRSLALRPGWNPTVWERSVLRAQDDATAGFRDDLVIPLFRAQLERILPLLDTARAHRRDDSTAKPSPSLVEEILAELEASKEDWAREAEAVLRQQMGAMGQEAYAQLGLDPEAFDLKDPAVTAWAEDHSFTFATDVVDTTKGTIRDSLAEGLDVGESYEDLARRLKQHYATWCGDDGDLDATRAMVIARTETIGAQNAGVLQGFAQSGVVEGKVWMTIGDANVRASHAALDGEIVGLDSAFSNGLEFPGDPNHGDAASRCNCRCSMQPAISVED